MTLALLALARPSDDLVAGLVIGAALGFLVGPSIRHLLAVREWAAASREARLTDDLLDRLPVREPEIDRRTDEGIDGPTDPHDVEDREPVPWPTSR